MDDLTTQDMKGLVAEIRANARALKKMREANPLATAIYDSGTRDYEEPIVTGFEMGDPNNI